MDRFIGCVRLRTRCLGFHFDAAFWAKEAGQGRKMRKERERRRDRKRRGGSGGGGGGGEGRGLNSSTNF